MLVAACEVSLLSFCRKPRIFFVVVNKHVINMYVREII